MFQKSLGEIWLWNHSIIINLTTPNPCNYFSHSIFFVETYGDAGQHKQGGGKYDSAEFANDQARRGQYDNNGRYEKDYGNQRNYNRNNYYDGKENLARRNLGNSYEGGARFAEQQYAHG